MCLGFILASVSIQGLLKTASTVVLLLPLLVLAVPIIDTSFVVARRLKHSRPIYTADQGHLHHRFLNIGFSQRRAAVTMWLWCASLAGAALATRFVPFREGGEWHLWQTVVVAAIALAAIAFSIFVIYLLEIVKLMNPRIRRRENETSEKRSPSSARRHKTPCDTVSQGVDLAARLTSAQRGDTRDGVIRSRPPSASARISAFDSRSIRTAPCATAWTCS